MSLPPDDPNRVSGPALATMVALVLLGIYAAVSSFSSPPQSNMGPATTTAVPIPTDEAQLELLAARASQEHGYHRVEGQVKNLSTAPLDNVQVVVTWLAADGSFVKIDTALIEYRPLLPGQTSPFTSLTPSHPAMARYRVEFSIFGGRALTMKDSRQ